MVGSRQGIPSWLIAAAAIRIGFEGGAEIMFKDSSKQSSSAAVELSDANLGFGERAFSAVGAAVLSAILVNPLDMAKTRLQAQAAGDPYQGYAAFKESQAGAKPARVWKTLHEVVNHAKSTNSFQIPVQRYRVLWTGLGAQLARNVPFSARILQFGLIKRYCFR